MKFLSSTHTYAGFFLFLFFFVGTYYPAQAQNTPIFLELQLDANLSNSQVIDLKNLVSNDSGNGFRLYSLFMQNQDPEDTIEDLYLDYKIISLKRGVLSDKYHAQGLSFNIEPGQQVFASNSALENGEVNLEGFTALEGGLTSEGKTLLNDLGGSTRLPPDRYIIKISIYQGNNSRNGGVLIASVQQEIGGVLVEDERDFYLTSPGDVVGSNVEINNPYPEFRWEGSRNVNYRLIVVGSKGNDSPESLLQGALSSAPILEDGAQATGSLLDFEVLDVRLRETSFQLPPSGVQPLEEGKKYYWQIFAELETVGGTEIRSSEIWSFTLASGSGALSAAAREELTRVLTALLQNSQIQELLRQGYSFGSVVIDGETYAGTAALQKLTDLMERANNGEITVVTN